LRFGGLVQNSELAGWPGWIIVFYIYSYKILKWSRWTNELQVITQLQNYGWGTGPFSTLISLKVKSDFFGNNIETIYLVNAGLYSCDVKFSLFLWNSQVLTRKNKLRPSIFFPIWKMLQILSDKSKCSDVMTIYGVRWLQIKGINGTYKLFFL
jgi:hypothetical protein